jgi:hypothetical protein
LIERLFQFGFEGLDLVEVLRLDGFAQALDASFDFGLVVGGDFVA